MNRNWHVAITLMIFTGILVFATPIAYAQVDTVIDRDSTLSSFIGPLAAQEVEDGDTLLVWPTGKPCGIDISLPDGTCNDSMDPTFGIPRAGIDWFDRDGNKFWSLGDDLHSEDRQTCGTADRDQRHDDNVQALDCEILDEDNNFPDGLLVDCDLETGGSPSMAFTPPCQHMDPNFPNSRLAFHDANNDGYWTDEEDIVVDYGPLNPDGTGTFEVPKIGGKLISVDKTAVILAGAQITTSWLIPVLIAAIGFGLVLARKIEKQKKLN